ncbi:MAG: ribosome silencing factor [Clostridiales bacterium]|nr:ribosome silencing factor [Candidatus Crickella merdequi]
MTSREMALEIAKALSDKKARDITLINISEKSSFADYFVNATAGNERQLGTLANEAEDKMAEMGFIPKNSEGRPETGWILVDCGDVIVNIFTQEVRERYSLDKIWSDCEIENVE